MIFYKIGTSITYVLYVIATFRGSSLFNGESVEPLPLQKCYIGVKKSPEPTLGSAKLAERAVKIRKIFRLRRSYGNLELKIPKITCNRGAK